MDPAEKEFYEKMETDFIKKVFLTLFACLALTLLEVYIFYSTFDHKELEKNKGWLVAAFLTWIITISILYCMKMADNYPLNFFVMLIFVISSGFVVAYFACKFDKSSVL